MLQRMDGQKNKFIADSYIRSIFQLGDKQFNKWSWWYGYINLNAKIFSFIWKF